MSKNYEGERFDPAKDQTEPHEFDKPADCVDDWQSAPLGDQLSVREGFGDGSFKPWRTHIDTSGEGGYDIPKFTKDPASMADTLRWIKEYLRQNPAADDPEGGQFPSKSSVAGVGPGGHKVIWSRPEGPEQLPPSWVVLPPESATPFEPTRRVWETLLDAPAPDENTAYRQWAADALGSLGLPEPPEPQERLGDQ